MTPAPPSVRIEPGLDAWRPRASPTLEHDRTQLINIINDRAQRLGTGALDPSCLRLIATGHQAQLWHPGILAKDIAMDVAVRNAGVGNESAIQGLHVVVDQDANEAWRLDVPTLEGDALNVLSSLLAPQLPGVPAGFQPPSDVSLIQKQLAEIEAPSIDRLQEAFNGLPQCASLAEQVAVVLARLKQPYAGDVPVMMVSDLAKLTAFISVVDRMLQDAHACASTYNTAVAQFPEAGMAPMVVGRELVELPLWAVAWNQPRRRVFVDLADSASLFVYDDGEPIDRSKTTLLPRALLLTAVMRGCLCDLFIHGTGGLIYDKITEKWWQEWAGEKLAPMAGATADVYLCLDAPIADHAGLARAVWHKHYLPNNLDRELKLTGLRVERKQHLLAHMNDDRDKARRRDAFRELKQINRDLAAEHADELEKANRALALARAGVGNATIAGRRDWCFALYPEQDLYGLGRLIEADRAVRGEVQSPP